MGAGKAVRDAHRDIDGLAHGKRPRERRALSVSPSYRVIAMKTCLTAVDLSHAAAAEALDNAVVRDRAADELVAQEFLARSGMVGLAVARR